MISSRAVSFTSVLSPHRELALLTLLALCSHYLAASLHTTTALITTPLPLNKTPAPLPLPSQK